MNEGVAEFIFALVIKNYFRDFGLDYISGGLENFFAPS